MFDIRIARTTPTVSMEKEDWLVRVSINGHLKQAQLSGTRPVAEVIAVAVEMAEEMMAELEFSL